MPSKTSLKDKLDGDHLDLSLSQLTEIPVEEMVSITFSYPRQQIMVNVDPKKQTQIGRMFII